MKALTKKLPLAINRALRSVGYSGDTVSVSARVSVGLSNPANDYARSFAGTVNLVSGQYEIEWSGFDDAERDDPFPSNPTIELSESLAVIKGSYENNSTYAYIYLHPDIAEQFRIEPVPLTPIEADILYTYKSIISKYRKRYLESARKKHPNESLEEAIENLINRGFLKRYPK
jgi:hypothetical protein